MVGWIDAELATSFDGEGKLEALSDEVFAVQVGWAGEEVGMIGLTCVDEITIFAEEGKSEPPSDENLGVDDGFTRVEDKGRAGFTGEDKGLARDDDGSVDHTRDDDGLSFSKVCVSFDGVGFGVADEDVIFCFTGAEDTLVGDGWLSVGTIGVD